MCVCARRAARASSNVGGQLGSDNVVCEIELRPQGAWVRQFHTEIMFEWRNAESIEDTIGA